MTASPASLPVVSGCDVLVVGLGLMGGAIAANLVRAGYVVAGVDPNGDARDRAIGAGVRAVENASQVTGRPRLVLSSLPSAAALDAVVDWLWRWDGFAGRLADLSTLSIEDKERAEARLAAHDIEMLDCPISGTGAQALTCDLSVYVSGSVEAWNELRAFFLAFARRPVHVGPFGAGTRMKLVANLLVAIHNVATAEAMALAASAGIDLQLAVDLLSQGAGNSRIFELRAPMMARQTYLPATMKLDVWMKDMDLIRQLARAGGVATPLLDATRPVYETACRQFAASDTAAVYEVLRPHAGPARLP